MDKNENLLIQPLIDNILVCISSDFLEWVYKINKHLNFMFGKGTL